MLCAMTLWGGGPIPTVTTVVIGAGHAGLAMSRCLAQRGVDHVVLERGEVANSWRTERWESLRLLTPNWQSRLPGYRYDGDDPDGYHPLAEVIDLISSYARTISAPVRTHTTVVSVSGDDDEYLVHTDRGDWRCRTVVLASGACNIARVPAFAGRLSSSVTQLTAQRYRNPAQLDPGGVLVVGASSSGVQIAAELQRSGRSVMLSVGEHIRVPRYYRGRDIEWWMDTIGLQDERYDEIDDIGRARRVPSLQLVGTPDRSTLDLNALSAIGVRLAGRVAGVTDGGRVQFSGSLRNMCALSDLKMGRLLDRIDEWAQLNGLDDTVGPPDRLPPTRIDDDPPLGIDLAAEGIRTVIWATGYRPDYSWLKLPVFDRKGLPRHDGGVVVAAGVYLMGLQFLRRRKSTLIDGAGDDARELSAHLANYLSRRTVLTEA